MDAGWYRAWLRVTDTDGLVDYDSVLITAGDTGYDEIEDNDDIWEENQATLLPAIPFAGFTGSMGDYQPDYVGYDGDNDDWFSFDAAVDDTVTVTIDYDSGTATEFYADFFDSEGDYLWGEGGTDPLVMVYTFAPGDVPPFYLDVYSWEYSDYTIAIKEGAAPVADLIADVMEGAPPLDVNFDAAGSYDPDGGLIVTYDWDWDGDGSYDDSGGDQLVLHQFGTDGWYQTTVRVWDEEGDSDTDVVWIFVPDAQSYYDENEDNDDFSQANQLPPFDFSGFHGSCGQTLDGNYPGYDGDGWDELELDSAAGVGDTVSLGLSFDPNGCYMLIVLFDANWNWWASDEGYSGSLGFEYTFTGDETPPYYLEVDCWDGGSDYHVDGALY